MNWLRYILTLIKYDAAERELMDLRKRNAQQQRIIENSHHNNDRLRAEVTRLHTEVRALRIAGARMRSASFAARVRDDETQMETLRKKFAGAPNPWTVLP